MKFLTNLTIAKKITCGFGLILAIMAFSSFTTYQSLTSMNKTQTRVVDLRYPTVITGQELLNGVNHSLAGLRGYMILGSDPAKAELFKNDRAKAWQNIDEALANYENFAKGWTVPANIELLKSMKSEFAQFRTAQQEVEDISHTDDNVPAFKLLLTDAAPRAGKILAAVTAIIDEESTLEATPERKTLLKNLADTRGSFAVGLANIRAYLLSGDSQFREGFEAKWKANVKAFDALSQQTKLFTDTQNTQWNTYVTVRKEFAPLPPQMFDLRSKPDWNLANYWLGSKAAPRAKAITGILAQLAESQYKLVDNDKQNLATASTTLNSTVITAAVISIGLGLFISIFLTRQIVGAIRSSIKRLQQIVSVGDGDLTLRMDDQRGDEMGDLARNFNDFIGKVQNLVVQVAQNSSQVAATATQIAATTEQLAAGMNQQTDQASQVSAAVEEMSQTVAEVARKSADASQNSQEAGSLAQNGGQVVSETIESINAIAGVVNDSSSAIGQLGEKSQEIGQVIEVINDIADQTNLLALNAAIEAARAGEHGRGFAVVADEVRKLAERTTTATQEVGDSIKAIQDDTATVVTQMSTGTERVNQGVQLAESAGQSLGQIVDGNQTVSSMIQQIASASEEQSVAANQIAQSIETMNSVTQQSAEATNQAAHASTDLSVKAEELQIMIQRFKYEN